METVLIVIHLMIVVALVGVILLQRSEGGALGMGGGGSGGFMSARGAADTLTRTTSILAAGFFVTSVALGLLARYGENPTDILDRVPASIQQQQPNADGTTPVPTQNGVLDMLGGSEEAPANGAEAPQAPETPAAPAVPNN